VDVLAKLAIEFVSPLEVRDELDEGVRAGHPVIDVAWVKFEPLSTPIGPIALAQLDRGEAAVIQLALDRQIATVAIDERKGRRAAGVAGLHVTGTLGLLGRAKADGVITAVRPYIERMQARSVWFDDDLVRLVRHYFATDL
jgi:predicted nucleic acid-binding protein